MITLESVLEAHPRMAEGCIDKWINPQDREGIFRASFIKVSEIHTNSPLASLLFDNDGVSQPLEIKDLF